MLRRIRKISIQYSLSTNQSWTVTKKCKKNVTVREYFSVLRVFCRKFAKKSGCNSPGVSTVIKNKIKCMDKYERK